MHELISIAAILLGFGSALVAFATARQTRLLFGAMTHRAPRHTLDVDVGGERISINLRDPGREQNEKIDHAIVMLRKLKNAPQVV